MLSCDLSDSIDIEMKTKEFIRCANCLHLNFGMCSPAVKSSLLRSFCMSFYATALWRMTCPELHSMETAVNKFLCRIWNLPYLSHTALTQRIASVQSLYNIVYQRCKNLMKAAKRCPSLLVRTVFCDAESVPWCFLGYNHLYGHRHIKLYNHLDDTIAQLIREIRSDYYYIPGFKKCDLEYIVNYIIAHLVS